MSDVTDAPILDKKVPLLNKDGELNRAEILQAFHDDGYVVVTDVFEEELVEQTINELWTSEQLLARRAANGSMVQRSDPSTWTKETWPQSDEGQNFLEALDPYLVQATWELLQHKPANDVFQLLWHEHQTNPGERLFMTDKPRWGVMRPTKNNPEWKTMSSWLHWDQNPWNDHGFTRVQGFAQLSEGTGESGGLLLVPKAHKAFCQWGAEHPQGTVFYKDVEMTEQYGKEKPFMVPEKDPLQQQVCRVVAPAGSLVLWDSRIPHQNFPNTSANEFRYIVYLNFQAKSEIPEEQLEDLKKSQYMRTKVLRALGIDNGYWPFHLTQLGAELTGVPNPEERAQAVRELEELKQQVTNFGITRHDHLVEAIQVAREASALEVDGYVKEAGIKLQQATTEFKRAGYDICEWEDGLWG